LGRLMTVLISGLGLTLTVDANQDSSWPLYRDFHQPVERRVEDLLGRMTLAEKIGQLWQARAEGDAAKEFAADLEAGGIGSFIGGYDTPQERNSLQRLAVEHSRLGIPLIFGHDSIHGFRTIFPIPLGQSCAWEPELFERTQTISARESAAAGIDWAFAPMVDLARDPRWGRIAEGFGEDPYLGALDAAASVRGFQGTNVADPNRVVACLKHFVGYGAAEGGRDYNTTEISDFTLRNFYLPQFKAGVDAGALTLMSAFSELSGQPASGNRHTLTDILRGEWNFSGYVVSDYNSVTEMINQGVVSDPESAARLALSAGVDMEMDSTAYRDTLGGQVQSGKIPLTLVDEAVRRILRVKFEKGLFERPYTDESLYGSAFLQPDALALAREAAAKSCVLLKDENHLLPLSKQIKHIALLGPLADAGAEMLGCWSFSGHGQDGVSLAAGLRDELPAAADISVVRGCDLTSMASISKRLDGTIITNAASVPSEDDGIARAVAAANAADAVILALGEPAGWSGENSSRSELNLPGRQQDLFDAVAATGKPVIVVLFNGRPLAIPQVAAKAAAILEAWHPGVQAGLGVADVLFGTVEPSGRLTTTFPRSVGQVPLYYNHSNTGRPDAMHGAYVDGPRDPLYPFGFGLSYTTFEFGETRLSTMSLSVDGNLTAQAEIKNNGDRPGCAVAELYIRDLTAPAGPRPVRELKGFQKLFLQPGETRTVSFSLSAKALGYYDARGDWLVEPGNLKVWIAPDSASGVPADFAIVDKINSNHAGEKLADNSALPH